MFKTAVLLAAVAGLALAVGSAHAAVSVDNPSFEDGALGDGGSGAGATGWLGNGGGRFNPKDGQFTGTTGAPGTIPGTGDGVQVAYMNSFAGGMHQNVGTIEANSVYELTVAIGQRLDLNWSNLTVSMRANSSTGALLASAVYTAADAPDGTFSDVSFSFSSADFAAEVGSDLYIVFQSNVQALYDNVRLTETLIPEPASLALLGLGGLAIVRRRK